MYMYMADMYRPNCKHIKTHVSTHMHIIHTPSLQSLLGVTNTAVEEGEEEEVVVGVGDGFLLLTPLPVCRGVFC